MANSKPINRTTIMKIPKLGDREVLVAAYAKLQSEATKDGKPYVLSLKVGPTCEEQRSKDYTFVAQTTFATLDDMRYYDNECSAHAELKSELKKMMTEPPLVIYFEDALDNSNEFVRLQ